MIECDAVFEGGGIKGIGLVGAASALEKSGYKFINVAGSSAGSIVAALIAAGYCSDDLEKEMLKLNYEKFKGKDFLDYLGFPGKLLSLSLSLGIFNIDFLESWVEDLLNKKNIRAFGDINGCCSDEKYKFGKNKCRLQITAVDLSEEKILILPDDLSCFGIKPESFSIAKAVRFSCSIPLFYEPNILTDARGCNHYIVDGGLMSNYPIWILDDGNKLNRPVFGFKFITEPDSQKLCATDKKDKLKIFDYIKTVISAGLDSKVQYEHTIKGDEERTVKIPVIINEAQKYKKIKSTDFEITKRESELLFQNGFVAGKKFLKGWDFEKWKKEFRYSN